MGLSEEGERARDRLIVALDFGSRREAMELVERMEGACRWFKVGMELFYAAGRGVVEELRGRGFEVFLDLKLHDIPNTVAGAVRSLEGVGASLLTVHAGGGPAMLEAARGAAGSTRLLAVTVLTSMDGEQLQAGGGGRRAGRAGAAAGAAGSRGGDRRSGVFGGRGGRLTPGAGAEAAAGGSGHPTERGCGRRSAQGCGTGGGAAARRVDAGGGASDYASGRSAQSGAANTGRDGKGWMMLRRLACPETDFSTRRCAYLRSVTPGRISRTCESNSPYVRVSLIGSRKLTRYFTRERDAAGC